MLCVLKDAEEDEASRYRGIQHAEEDKCRDHEGECDLLVWLDKRAKCGSRNVLVASVSVDHSPDDAEDNDLADRASPECLWEVPVKVISKFIRDYS